MITLHGIAPERTRKRRTVDKPNSKCAKSELCAVGYYCAWDGVAKAFSLKRLFKDSDATVTSLQGPTVNFTTLYTKVPANEEDLAACVWDLGCAPGVGADIRTSFDSVHELALDRSSVQIDGADSSPQAKESGGIRKHLGYSSSRSNYCYRNTILAYRTAIRLSERLT